MATHSSILAWRIPWTEEPGGLQSLGSQRVRHDWTYMQPPLTKRCHNNCLHTLSNFYISVIGSFNSVLQMRKLRVRKLILTFYKFMQLFSGTGRMKTQNCLAPTTCFIMHPHLYISSDYRSGNDLSVTHFTTQHCYQVGVVGPPRWLRGK